MNKMLNDEMMNESLIDKNISRTESPDLDKLVEIAIKRKTEEYFPLIVFYSIATCFGIIGNSLTVRFYGFKAKRSTTFVLIALLSAFDSVVCFFCFTNIIAMFVYVFVTYKIVCKTGFFLYNWSIRSSTLALWVIAIERYRHVCKYGQKQLTVKLAVIIVIGLSAMAMIYSTQSYLMYETVRVNISTSDNEIPYVSVHYCTYTKEPVLQPVISAFYIIDILFYSVVSFTFVYTYGNIWWTYRKHNKNTAYLHNKPTVYPSQQSACSKEVHQNDADKDKEKEGQLRSDAIVNVDLDKENTETLHVTTFITAGCSSGAESQTAATNYSAKDEQSIKASQISQSERNITKLMFAVIVGLYCCFIPYIFVQGSIESYTESALNTGVQFAIRLPFLNSMINPFICFAFHREFRFHVKGIFTKCKPRKVEYECTSG